jgi:hypothetical protein
VSTAEAASPMARGWYQHQDDPAGIHRWFDGSGWTHRTTGRPHAGAAALSPVGVSQPLATASTQAAPAAPLPQVPPPASRGWYEYPGDPAGVQRWYDGTQWTNRLTGGTEAAQWAAVRLTGSSLPASRPSATPAGQLAQSGFIPMMYNPSTGESAYVDPASGTLRVRPRYGNGRRVGYTFLWSFYTLLLGIGGLTALANAQILSGLVASALAVLTGRYAIRIWTYRARTLWLLLFF